MRGPRLTLLGWTALSAATADALLRAADAWACAVCLGWTDDQRLNSGFYWSALLLTLLPFVVVTSIGSWLGYTVWRARSRQDSETAEPPSTSR